MKKENYLNNLPELYRALEIKNRIEKQIPSSSKFHIPEIEISSLMEDHEALLVSKEALENGEVWHELEGARTIINAISDVVKVMSIEKTVIRENYQNVLKGIVGVLNQVPKIETPFMSFLSEFIELSIIPRLAELNLYPREHIKTHICRKIHEGYMQHMYEAKWFPYVRGLEERQLILDVYEIISKTKKSKSRIKKIDQCVYTYFTKQKIEKMRKAWREKNVDYCRMKMLNQAVNAFYRKEYALTIITMATMWEGIIKDKAKGEGKKAIEVLKELQDAGEVESIVISYCKDFIFYQCYSKDELKEDVPGRHAIAHSWYRKYPSKKSALNAILFTDFLLNIETMEGKREKKNEDT